MKNHKGIQLELNFNGVEGNRFKEHLDNGNFTVLIEMHSPPGNTKMADAYELGAEMEYTVCARTKVFSALAFTDRWSYQDAMDNIEYASTICQQERDRHVLFLSGRMSRPEKMLDAAGHAKNEGFRNVIPVSGRCRKEDTLRSMNSGKIFFTESVLALRSLKDNFGDFLHLGTVVNPYQYTVCSSMAQTCKFMKKVSAGASFAISNYGWDLKKLQEMRCSLFRRGLTMPLLGGFMMLTPDYAEEICAGKVPGVRLSPDLQVMLRREAMHSTAQFEAAQLRRLQIHAAGAKFLGCSGLVLSHVEKPAQAEILLRRIEEALEEFSSFQEYLEAYNEYYGRLNMAPYPYQFYAFEDLLKKVYTAELPEIANVEFPEESIWAKVRTGLLERLCANAHTLPSTERGLTKKFLASCRSCPSCRLPLTAFVCPERCPRKMANGPCGSVQVDGSCIHTEKECIFAEQIRYAASKNDFACLEEIIAPQVGQD
ncbi:MAG: methylenetetrahydrofolate reductase C-terminal domain-containing protein [Lentisphaeria bacterium]|nr:methylenetetrahydrofolate reductase C-terminal domain-containing protein [Lentisphaeria bacterium]